jgi:PKD repeat protein
MEDAPDLVLDGQGFRDNFGTSASGAGDFNGDGFADFIVGAWMNDAGGTDAGRAYLYYGGPSMDEFPDRVFTGVAAGDLFGREVAGGGDVNGDGFADVAVGAQGNDAGGSNAGRVYVFFGGPGADTVADLILTGAAPEDRFGYSVSSAGDVNRDGFGDIIVGAYANDAGGPDAGRAYVFFGGVAPDATADWILTGEAPGDRFGVEVAAAGDPNGDQYADVIVGADYNDAGGSRAGRAYLYRGGAAPDAIADVVFTGPAPEAGFGASASAAGDMDGDGFGDLVVGSWLYSGDTYSVGRADVYLGGPSMDALPDLTLIGERTDDRLGVSVAGLGDANGDGRSEIAVGAYYYDAELGEEGRAYVVAMEQGDAPPVVTAPAEMAVNPGSLLSFQVTASDPDGDVIASLTASPLPEGATFVPTAGNTSGDFAWTPNSGQAGTHVVVFTATNGRSGSAATTITVGGGNLPPILSAPASAFGAEGVVIAFEVSATDPEGAHVTLGIVARPVGALFIDLGNNTGAFSWTPGFGQAGSYLVTFTAHDVSGASTAKAVSITVDDVNRAPTAAPGGPYTSVINAFITFDGTASSDPDGDPLAYEWAFGDAFFATGPNPVHAYELGGVFTVTLRVSDGTASHTASTIATIQDVFPAAASLDAGNETTRLQSGKSATCVQIEPVDGAYANTNVDVATLEMISFGTGSVNRIYALPGKTTIGSDRDRNGIDEITACFSKDDLRRLFGALSGGKHTVGVALEADLTTGGRIRATLEMDVVVSGGSVAASVSPNPLNPSGVITVRAAQAGRVRVLLFDINGRLVRNLLDGSFPSGGYHDVPIDGRRDDGSRLGSGVYFYRVETREGTATGRIAVVN